MKKGLGMVWVIVITVTVMAGLGAGGWYLMGEQQKAQKKDWEQQVTQLQFQVKELQEANAAKEDASAPKNSSTDSPSGSSAQTTTVNPYLYTNTTYGFTLSFNSLWEGYQIKETTIAGATKTYYACVPTSDPLYTSASSTSLAGTVSLFAFSVYTQAQWTVITSEEGPAPSLVGQSGGWYVGYSPAQAYPEDKAPLASDVSDVLVTFAQI